jgi:hypothetical protein
VSAPRSATESPTSAGSPKVVIPSYIDRIGQLLETGPRSGSASYRP